MKKYAAIAHARNNVSSLFVFGDGYKFLTYDAGGNAWRESQPLEYWTALSYRSQALIDVAREFLKLPPMQYDGGAWTDYV